MPNLVKNSEWKLVFYGGGGGGGGAIGTQKYPA